MRPAALDRLPESGRVYLDVREEIRGEHEPFGRIIEAVDRLDMEGVLVLTAPFEPVPLYRVLSRRGFAHFTERRAADHWTVWFYRDPAAPAASASPAPVARLAPPAGMPAPGAGLIRLDVRGLEPPLPMVRVLEAVESLGPGQRLEVLHDRRPLFLYPQLEARGLRHVTDEPEPGLVRIAISREGPAA
jgi:uncharacterized protein (DUF2249 family)